MTNQNIDSSPQKLDRQIVLIAGNNDRAITKMVAEHARFSDALDKLDYIPDEVLDATMTAANNATTTLHETPADSLAGVREKVRWMRRPENFNDGCLGGCRVLISIFEDIERLA